MTSLLNAIVENAVDFSLLEQGYNIGLNWLGHFVRVIIEGIGILGVGIIVFTLILKAITLPFDIYQRVKMRKQSLIMKQMQPELEKLQKQYANDKTMYNQKMMELYKKNGYSMLGACLPMIISLVILIVAISGFRSYSSYANLKMYVEMSEQYNSALIEYRVDGIDPMLGDEIDGEILEWEEGKIVPDSGKGVIYTMFYPTDAQGEQIHTKYMQAVSANENDKLCIYYIYSLENETVVRQYKIDIDKLKACETKVIELIAEAEGKSESVICREFMVQKGAEAVANWYYDKNEQHDAHFLWVKNVWYPDVSYDHPIQSYSSFIKQFGNTKVTLKDTTKVTVSEILSEDNYNNLISGLNAETSKPNGYFVLIILSIGLMLLSQFLSMRSQKESNKYQSVDGSAARTQKMMLIIMPLIYAVFAFMYSAAFSIYMVMSSFMAILVTLVSNFAIGRVFKKKEEAAIKEKYTRTLPWMKDKSYKNNKNNNKKK